MMTAGLCPASGSLASGEAEEGAGSRRGPCTTRGAVECVWGVVGRASSQSVRQPLTGLLHFVLSPCPLCAAATPRVPQVL